MKKKRGMSGVKKKGMMDGLEEKKVRAGFASVGRRQIIYF